MKKTSLLLIALLSLALSGQVQADPIIVASPSVAEGEVGSTVDVLVSMTNLTGELVGAFDLSLIFDNSILAVDNIFFGTALDGPTDSIQGSFVGVGSADAFEISFSFLFEQDGFTDFLLFGVTFDVVGVGLTSLDPFVWQVEDYFASPLSVDHQGSEFLGTAAHQVPEPGTLGLFALGLIGLALHARRRRKA